MSYTLGAREFSLPDDIAAMIKLGRALAEADIAEIGGRNTSRTPLENCAEHFRGMLETVVPIIFRTAANEPLGNRRQAFGLSVMLTAQLCRWVEHLETEGYGPERLTLSNGTIGSFSCFCLAAKSATAPQISLGNQRDNYQLIRSGGMVRRLQKLVCDKARIASGGREDFLLLSNERPSRREVIFELRNIAPSSWRIWGMHSFPAPRQRKPSSNQSDKPVAATPQVPSRLNPLTLAIKSCFLPQPCVTS